MGRIVIDDGVEEYIIENKQGKVLGSIFFNASDVSMMDRYDDVIKNIKAYEAKLSEDDVKDTLALKKSFEDMLTEQLNYLFGNDVADKFFLITSPLTPLASGQLYFENVLEAIGGLIESTTGRRHERLQSRIRKYAGKYNG